LLNSFCGENGDLGYITYIQIAVLKQGENFRCGDKKVVVALSFFHAVFGYVGIKGNGMEWKSLYVFMFRLIVFGV
jgi:hypothetical protein